MKSFVNDLYDYNYTGEQVENNAEESGDDEEIDIKLTGEENATNENNENVIEMDLMFMYRFLFQLVLDMKKRKIFINNLVKSGNIGKFSW